MQKKFDKGLQGIQRLLLVQAALASACLWFGFIMYQLPAGGKDQLMLLLVVPVLAGLTFAPISLRWIGGVMLAAGLMTLFSHILPAGWFQGPLFVLLAAVSAAVAIMVARRGVRPEPVTP